MSVGAEGVAAVAVIPLADTTYFVSAFVSDVPRRGIASAIDELHVAGYESASVRPVPVSVPPTHAGAAHAGDAASTAARTSP